MPDVVNLAFGFLFIAIATFVLATPLIVLWLKKTTKPPRTAIGFVQETAIIHDDESDPMIQIRYSFSVQGQPYWGQDKITIEPFESSKELLRRFAIGSEIQIEYHPDDPDTQSLIRQTDANYETKGHLAWHLLQIVVFVVVFYAIGFGLVFSSLDK